MPSSENSKILGVIPARYASTRFPGKPLAMICGKPMIQWTYENSLKCSLLDQVVIATDDERIFNTCKEFGGNVVMTSNSHPTGTDRVREVAIAFPEYSHVVNIQGDEPGIEKDLLEGTIQQYLKNPDWEMGTAAVVMTTIEAEDPNRVKLVFDSNHKAQYFSRNPIPAIFPKSNTQHPTYYRHIGIYIYKRSALLEYPTLPKSDWEAAESLEQLRGLQNGFRISVYIAKSSGLSVDTPEDLKVVEKEFQKIYQNH